MLLSPRAASTLPSICGIVRHRECVATGEGFPIAFIKGLLPGKGARGPTKCLRLHIPCAPLCFAELLLILPERRTRGYKDLDSKWPALHGGLMGRETRPVVVGGEEEGPFSPIPAQFHFRNQYSSWLDCLYRRSCALHRKPPFCCIYFGHSPMQRRHVPALTADEDDGTAGVTT